MAHTVSRLQAVKLSPVVNSPDAVAVARWARDEMDALVRRLNAATFVEFEVQHHEPEKPRIGLTVYADGTDWNPDGASGEGLYVYKSGGWTFIV